MADNDVPTREQAELEVLTLRTAASIDALRSAGWKPHHGMQCWYMSPAQSFSYGLPGTVRVPMTDEERLYLVYGQITYPPGGRIPKRL